MEIVNARIERTMLGPEDHGILTAYLHLVGDCWGQGFGGYGLDAWDERKRERVGSAWGMEFIRLVLKVLEVERWEDLPGTIVRVRYADTRHHGSIEAIGHCLKDQWLNPKEIKL